MGTSDAAKAYDAEGDRTRLEAPSGTPSRSYPFDESRRDWREWSA